jgi:purine-binding chemotaxis protein CheW
MTSQAPLPNGIPAPPENTQHMDAITPIQDDERLLDIHENEDEINQEDRGTPLQLIAFTVDDTQFAFDIRAVREIRAWSSATMVPNAPRYVRGVINMRGTIVPIYDLRARLGGTLVTPTPFHVVIVTTVMNKTMGILVDGVSDILNIYSKQIAPPPEIGNHPNAHLLDGLVSEKGQMVGLLSLLNLFDQHTDEDTE